MMLHMLIRLCGSRVPPFIACYHLQNTKLTLWYLFQRHAHEQVKQALSSIICKTQALHLHHRHHIIPPSSSPQVPFQSHTSLTPLQCPPKEPMNENQSHDFRITSSSRKIIRTEPRSPSRKTLPDNHLRGRSCSKTFLLPRTIP